MIQSRFDPEGINWMMCCQSNLPNAIYIQNFKSVNFADVTNPVISFVFKNYPLVKNFVNFMHVLHYGLLHYGMLKVLHITSFRSRFDALKLASHISHVLLWLHRQNGLKRVIGPNEAGTTFETISAAAAGRVKTIHRCLQASSIAVHMYPALQLPQIKLLPMRFWEWKICAKSGNHKNHENITSLKILYIYRNAHLKLIKFIYWLATC